MRIIDCAFDFKPEEPKLCWVITQKCNLSCAHCCSNSSPNQNTTIDVEKGKFLLEQAALLGIKRIVFSGGEPLLVTALSKLSMIAVSLGMTPSLSTNGTFINTDVANRLLKVGIRKATVSLDGNQEQHDRLRHRQGAFASAILGATTLCKAGIQVTLNCLLRPEVIKNLYKLYEVAVDIGANELTFTFPLYAGRMGGMSEIYFNTWKSGDKFVKVIADLDLKWKHQIETTIFQPRCGTSYCPAGKLIFGAISENAILPCVYNLYSVVTMTNQAVHEHEYPPKATV